MVMCFSISAQEKESNQDLRKDGTLFKLSDIKSKSAFRLMHNNLKEYYLQKNDNAKGRLRLSTDKMREIDSEFVQKFFIVKHVLGQNSQKKCDKAYEMMLRGEPVVVCSGEEKKVAEVKKLMTYLNGFLTEN